MLNMNEKILFTSISAKSFDYDGPWDIDKNIFNDLKI